MPLKTDTPLPVQAYYLKQFIPSYQPRGAALWGATALTAAIFLVQVGLVMVMPQRAACRPISSAVRDVQSQERRRSSDVCSTTSVVSAAALGASCYLIAMLHRPQRPNKDAQKLLSCTVH